ncbi:MAG: LytR C-terminal domain-containing protein, partial [Curtobacterium sp.]
GIDLSSIRSTTIPTSGTPTIDGYSTVAVDFAAMPAFIQGIVGAPAAYIDAKAATPSSVHVSVQNGGSTPGGATAASAALTAKGFVVGAPSDTTTTAATVVEYPKGAEAEAKAVVAAVPGATAVRSTTVSGVTLVLGTDGHTVAAAGGARSGSSGAASGSAAHSGTSGSSGSGARAGSSGSSGSRASGSGASGSSAPAATPSSTPVGSAYGEQGACIN